MFFGAFLHVEPCYLSHSHIRKEAAITGMTPRGKNCGGEKEKMQKRKEKNASLVTATEVFVTIPGATSASKIHREE